MYSKKYIKRTMLLLGMTALVMCGGCGKQKDKGISDDFDNVAVVATGQDATNDENNQSDYSVPEHVKFDEFGEKTNSVIHVDADVIENGYRNAAVYEVTLVDFDEDYIKNLASRLFDNGEYAVQLPYWHMSKEQLNNVMEERNVNINNPILDDNGCATTSYTGMYVYYIEETIDGSQEAPIVDGQIFYPYNAVYREKTFDPANGIYREVGEDINDTMEYARLTGKINGKQCQLMVSKSTKFGETRVWIVSDELCTASNIEYEIGTTGLTENLCDYDKALSSANDMVKKITDTEYDLCMTMSRSVNSQIEGYGRAVQYDGYKFYFTPVISDYPIIYNSAYTIMSDETQYVNQPMLMIEIDSYGLVEAKYLTDFSIDGCMSDAPTVLTFEKSQEELKKQIQLYLQETSGLEITIDRIEFSHVLLRQDNQYAIVPVWMYYISNAGYQSIKDTAAFGVNALDGSTVLFGNVIDDFFFIIGDL